MASSKGLISKALCSKGFSSKGLCSKGFSTKGRGSKPVVETSRSLFAPIQAAKTQDLSSLLSYAELYV